MVRFHRRVQETPRSDMRHEGCAGVKTPKDRRHTDTALSNQSETWEYRTSLFLLDPEKQPAVCPSLINWTHPSIYSTEPGAIQPTKSRVVRPSTQLPAPPRQFPGSPYGKSITPMENYLWSVKKTPSQGVQSSQPWLGGGGVIPLRGREKQSWGWSRIVIAPHPSRPGLPAIKRRDRGNYPPSHIPLLPPRALSAIKHLLGGGAPVGNTSPGIPPSRMPPQVAQPVGIN